MNPARSPRRSLLILLVLAAAGLAGAPLRAADATAPGGTGDGPPIDLTCVGLMAPAVVHVRCGILKDAAGNPTGSPLDYRYEWDFGDPGSRWNELPGWNAAHVYDRPGQYTITLTVRGVDGVEHRRTTWVRIAADNRQRVYVSGDGNDAFDGSNPGRAVRSVPRAFHLAKDNAWVLFRKGDVFEISAPVHLYGRGLRVGNFSRNPAPEDVVQLKPPPGVVIKPPPAEPLPVLKKIAAPPKNDSMFYVQKQADDTLFEGIEFDSMWDLKSEFGLKKIPARAFTVGGQNFAVRWCSFRNLTDGINTEMKPTGVLVLENHFSEEIRGYCIYANGDDHVYVGNVMIHSRQEHLIRATEPGVMRILIAYNDLSRPNKAKGCIELRMASWFCVANNYLHNGTLRVGPQEQDKNQFPAWKEYKCDWGIVQDNRMEQLFLNIRLGTYHMTFRNNIIRNDPKQGPPKPEDGDWAIIIECAKPGYDEVRKIADVRIEHNTILNFSGHGQLLYLSGKPASLVVRNNVYITGNQPGSAGAIFMTAGDADGVEAENNIYPNNGAGTIHVNKQPVDRNAWMRSGHAKNERWGSVPFDAEDNVPIETGAGAKLGNDRTAREAKRAKEGTPPTGSAAAPR